MFVNSVDVFYFTSLMRAVELRPVDGFHFIRFDFTFSGLLPFFVFDLKGGLASRCAAASDSAVAKRALSEAVSQRIMA